MLQPQACHYARNHAPTRMRSLVPGISLRALIPSYLLPHIHFLRPEHKTATQRRCNDCIARACGTSVDRPELVWRCVKLSGSGLGRLTPSHICTGTGLTRFHICTRTGPGPLLRDLRPGACARTRAPCARQRRAGRGCVLAGAHTCPAQTHLPCLGPYPCPPMLFP